MYAYRWHSFLVLYIHTPLFCLSGTGNQTVLCHNVITNNSSPHGEWQYYPPNVFYLLLFICIFCYSYPWQLTLSKKNRNLQYLINVEKVFISSQNITVYKLSTFKTSLINRKNETGKKSNFVSEVPCPLWWYQGHCIWNQQGI